MTNQVPSQARVVPLRPGGADASGGEPAPRPEKEPLWRDVVGDVLRRERLAQERTLKDVADEARISMPYLSELERGRKEASSEVLAAAARALGFGLADLLALAQGQILRRTPSLTSRPPAGSTTPVTATARGAVRRAPNSSYDGMCLAA